MPVPNRTSSDPNSSADINTLQSEITGGDVFVFSTPGTNQTLTSASSVKQDMSPSVDISVTVDNSFTVGMFKSNDGDTICLVIPGSWLTIVAKQTTPTDATHWKTAEAGGGEVAYTPTYTGFGTVSADTAYGWREGPYFFFRQNFTAGSTTATEARSSLPFGISSVSTIATLELAGHQTNDNATDGFVMIEASKAYVVFSNFGLGLAKANGNGIVNNGNVVSLYGKVPISGWEIG